MPVPEKLFIALGSANGALVVALGAFGAHVLKSRISGDMLAVYQTAVLYHAVHSLGLLCIGLAALWIPGSGLLRAAGWTMLGGILLFSGSLYAMSAAGVRGIGVVTPIGGIALIAAWVLFCAAALRASG